MTAWTAKAHRLESLDAFRGLTIAAMILVNNPGSWAHVYPPLLHAEWHGWTPTDLIFPFFLFIVGVSVPFSFAKRLARGDSRQQLLGHILRRSLILFGLGIFMAAFPRFDIMNVRIMGVLQRIGVVYLFAAPAYLYLKGKGRGVALVGLLLGYWALLTLVPVPGFGAGDLSPEGNLGAYLDRLILGDHLWREMWDPEGLLSTLPAIGTTLLGIYAGEWIRAGASPSRGALGLVAAGVACLAVGTLWGWVFPINKGIWTSSYVIFTAGAASLLLGTMFWIMEVRGWKGWARPFVVYGMNAIAVFVASGLLARVLGIWRVGAEGVSMKEWLYETLFASWAGPLNGSLAFALSYVLFWLFLMWLLFRRGVFIKI
ncbi:MAG: acyltransferase family protein [Longimicrobiales bacterium]